MAVDLSRTGSSHEEYQSPFHFSKMFKAWSLARYWEQPASITETGGKVRYARGCRSRLSLWLGATVLVVWSSQAPAQSNAAWWGTVGSGGTVNIGDESNVVFDGPTVSVKPGMSAKIRYNVVAVESITKPPNGCEGFSLRVRYRDEFNQAVPQPGFRIGLIGANSASITIWQQQIFGGGITRIGLYDSDLKPAKSGFQTMESGMFSPPTFDFSASVYWIEVMLDNRNKAPVPLAPGLPPAVAGIQIIASGCIN